MVKNPLYESGPAGPAVYERVNQDSTYANPNSASTYANPDSIYANPNSFYSILK